jgi:hypothetical protein
LNDFSRFPPFDYNGYLDLLTAKNHNFIRLWMAKKSYGKLIDPALSYFTPIPFSRVSGHGNSADGGLKFDLSLFDQSWFNRMRARVIAAGSTGIYVDIVLFNGWWIDGRRRPTGTVFWTNAATY